MGSKETLAAHCSYLYPNCIGRDNLYAKSPWKNWDNLCQTFGCAIRTG